MEETTEAVDKVKETKQNPLGSWLKTGGPGRKGVPNRFTQQRNEFFKACKDGKLFVWVQEILNGKDNRMKMEVLRVWASLQPKEVRAEFDSPQNLVTIVINRKEEPIAGNKVIDIGGKDNA